MVENVKNLVKLYIQHKKSVALNEFDHIEILNLENEDFNTLVSFATWLNDVYSKLDN